MSDINLLKRYRMDEPKSREKYESIYHSEFAHIIGIPLRQMNASHSYPAFYYYTETMVQILSDIMMELRDLSILADRLPGVAIHSFQRTCLIEEIQSSNEIEGVRSTRKEIQNAMDESQNNGIRLWSMVHKYQKLQQKEEIPFRTSRDLRVFYDEFLADEIRRSDETNLPDGKLFRKETVEIWNGTRIIHRGILPEEKIISYMDTALAILQNEHIPGLIRVSIFHYLFGYIHPFYDGNGRTSRFITSYYIAKFLNPFVAIRLSITIRKSLRVYYKLFEDTNHQGNYGDLSPFITGFLWLIQKSIHRVHDILQEKGKKLFSLEKAVKASPDIPSQKERKIYDILLQAYLFSDEGATVEEIAHTLGQSTRTIRTHLTRYPADHIEVDPSHKAHRYKLSEHFVQKLEQLALRQRNASHGSL